MKDVAKHFGKEKAKAQGHGDTTELQMALLTPQYPNRLEIGRPMFAEGGTTEDQMNALAISVAPARVEEQETHTMPDGTEMPGATHE